MDRIAYFPGCSLHGTAVEYDESLMEIAKSVGLQLEEINDWNCCGATAAHSLNSLLGVALPARNLAIAERDGFDDMLVPCAACFSRLAHARHEIKYDEKYKSKVPEIIDMPLSGRTNPITVLDFLEKYVMPKLSESIKQKLNAKVACYYGCLMTRPAKLTNIERREDPLVMEEMMTAIGAKPIDWAYKVECCGAGLSVTRTDIVGKLSAKIIEDAESRGAEMIIVACPMCQSNLDMRRDAINQFLSTNSNIPILFITQAIGLALGIDRKKLGLDRHLVPTTKVDKMIKSLVEV